MTSTIIVKDNNSTRPSEADALKAIETISSGRVMIQHVKGYLKTWRVIKSFKVLFGIQ